MGCRIEDAAEPQKLDYTGGSRLPKRQSPCYAGRAMKCPHCSVAIHSGLQRHSQIVEASLGLPGGGTSYEGVWNIYQQRCPECGQTIILLERTTPYSTGRVESFMAYPRRCTRPVPAEVPDPYRQDYVEACSVLGDSPKASAALSRRNLQAVLRDKAGTKSKDLFDQIEEVISSGRVPSHIAEGLHAVRNIGNFAAHTIKSTTTGAIVDVEPGEAEWNLDVLDSLFDFYFVSPPFPQSAKQSSTRSSRTPGSLRSRNGIPRPLPLIPLPF